MPLDIKPVLQKILTTARISGREEEIAKVVKEEFEKYCDEVSIHPTHSVIGLKKTTQKTNNPTKTRMENIPYGTNTSSRAKRNQPGSDAT